MSERVTDEQLIASLADRLSNGGNFLEIVDCPGNDATFKKQVITINSLTAELRRTKYVPIGRDVSELVNNETANIVDVNAFDLSMLEDESVYIHPKLRKAIDIALKK